MAGDGVGLGGGEGNGECIAGGVEGLAAEDAKAKREAAKARMEAQNAAQLD